MPFPVLWLSLRPCVVLFYAYHHTFPLIGQHESTRYVLKRYRIELFDWCHVYLFVRSFLKCWTTTPIYTVHLLKLPPQKKNRLKEFGTSVMRTPCSWKWRDWVRMFPLTRLKRFDVTYKVWHGHRCTVTARCTKVAHTRNPTRSSKKKKGQREW